MTDLPPYTRTPVTTPDGTPVVGWSGPPGAEPFTKPTHRPCCSSHGVAMTCARYRRTHFVEVRPCCAVDVNTLAVEARPAFERHRLPGCGTAAENGRCTCVRCYCGRPAHGWGTACGEHDTPFTPSDVLAQQVAEFCESGGDQ